MKPRDTRAAARHAARQILAGEWELMSHRQFSQLWFLICQNFREPNCPAAFAHLQAWQKRFNDEHYRVK